MGGGDGSVSGGDRGASLAPFRFTRLEIPDVVVVERSTFSDDRGFFAETYRATAFASFGLPQAFSQDAHSRSRQGVLRGLHYQRSPMAQGKFVWVATGRILDVAVDLRRSAATFGRWVSLELAADNRLGLYIPPGFAHGFYTLSDLADVMYKLTQEYSPSHEGGIVWNDPDIGIVSPVTHPTVSARDAAFPRLRDADPAF